MSFVRLVVLTIVFTMAASCASETPVTNGAQTSTASNQTDASTTAPATTAPPTTTTTSAPPEPIPLTATCDREGTLLAEALVALVGTLLNPPELDSEDLAGSTLAFRQAANSLDLIEQRLDNVIITARDDGFVEVAGNVSFFMSETTAALEGIADAVAALDVPAMSAAVERFSALDTITDSVGRPVGAWFRENCPELGNQLLEDLEELG